MACCQLKISGQVATLLVSFTLLVVYMMIGAAVFSAIELPHEQKGHNISVDRLRHTNLSSSFAVQTLTYKHNSSACVALEAIRYFKNRDANGTINGSRIDDDDEFQWTYTKSMMFAFSTITTLGYGDLIPTTHIGKGMTLLFALTCIPLYYMMVMLYARQGLGATNRIVERYANNPGRAFLIRNAIFLGVLTLAALFFSAVYCFTNGIDYGNSLWYAFATFTTLGFGDHYPLSNSSWHAFYFLVFVTLVYIFIGIVILAWRDNFLKLHRSVSWYSASIFGLFCIVSHNTSLQVEVGMSRLPEEPVDAEMEAVQFEPASDNDEDVFTESLRVQS